MTSKDEVGSSPNPVETTEHKQGRRARPVTPEGERFGALLREIRAISDWSQQRLADRLDVSLSFLAKIEAGRANHSFSRDQVWSLLEKSQLPPSQYDSVLKAGGFDTNRSLSEELTIELTFPQLTDVWVFSRELPVADEKWLTTVKTNLHRGVCYRFFVGDNFFFNKFRIPLCNGANPVTDLEIARQVEILALPSELFLTSMTLYNPGKPDMFCSGAKTLFGRADTFYTIDKSESWCLSETLASWADRIYANVPILQWNPKHISGRSR